MSDWQGYKGNRKSVGQRMNEDRLKQVEKLDVPLLWLPTWDKPLTAAQRYRQSRGLL